MPEQVADHKDQLEVEWQFDALDVRPIGRWLEGGASGEAPTVSVGEMREISDTYFDTEDWRIYRAGYALRVRRAGSKKPEATMKLLNSADGTADLRRRREISGPLDGAGAEALIGASGAVGERVRALVGSRSLRPIFEVSTRRSAYPLILDGAEVGEVALDETSIPLENGAEPAALRRVEVEVEPEAFSAVEPFVESLREECRLAPATASKYEAGLFVRQLRPPEPPDLGPKVVDGSLTVGEMAFAVMREQFEKFLAHEPGTRLGEDPEELHDMRVASRRLRAALRIFDEALPVRARKLQEELRWIAGVLGEVRDLDVQLEQIETWTSEAVPEDWEPLGALRSVLEEQREKNRKAMLRALDSRRYANLVESLTGFLRRGPSRRSRAARRPVLAVAPDLIKDRYRKVRKLGDRLAEDSPGEDYHTLRKRGKRLRYALEFLSDLYGDPAKDLVKPLKTLQDVLGDHQDAEVAVTNLRELSTAKSRGRKLPPQAVFVMGGIAHRYQVQARELRGRFPKAYGEIRGKPWRKLKKVMEKARPRDAEGSA